MWAARWSLELQMTSATMASHRHCYRAFVTLKYWKISGDRVHSLPTWRRTLRDSEWKYYGYGTERYVHCWSSLFIILFSSALSPSLMTAIQGCQLLTVIIAFVWDGLLQHVTSSPSLSLLKLHLFTCCCLGSDNIVARRVSRFLSSRVIRGGGMPSPIADLIWIFYLKNWDL